MSPFTHSCPHTHTHTHTHIHTQATAIVTGVVFNVLQCMRKVSDANAVSGIAQPLFQLSISDPNGISPETILSRVDVTVLLCCLRDLFTSASHLMKAAPAQADSLLLMVHHSVAEALLLLFHHVRSGAQDDGQYLCQAQQHVAPIIKVFASFFFFSFCLLQLFLLLHPFSSSLASCAVSSSNPSTGGRFLRPIIPLDFPARRSHVGDHGNRRHDRQGHRRGTGASDGQHGLRGVRNMWDCPCAHLHIALLRFPSLPRLLPPLRLNRGHRCTL